MARLTLARKMAAITLTIWKKGVDSTPSSIVSTLDVAEIQTLWWSVGTSEY